MNSIDTLRSSSLEKSMTLSAEPSASSSASLAEVFREDRLIAPLDTQMTAPAPAASSPSLWERICTWWSGKPQECTLASNSQEMTQQQRIDFKPSLDSPDHMPTELAAAHFPKVPSKYQALKMTPSEIEQGLSEMSDETIEKVLFIIFHTELQLQKENAQITDSTFSKYLQFQKKATRSSKRD